MKELIESTHFYMLSTCEGLIESTHFYMLSTGEGVDRHPEDGESEEQQPKELVSHCLSCSLSPVLLSDIMCCGLLVHLL